MIPAGYLLKKIAPPPGWLTPGLAAIVDVCSVSDCVNDNVVDLQSRWLHNEFGLADTPEVLWGLAHEAGAVPIDAVLFYCEAYELELESDGWTFDPAGWRPLSPVPSAQVFPSAAIPRAPEHSILLGYDVVVFGDYLEHSPLSCNSVAETLPVNAHCLFDHLEQAREAIDTGGFGGGCEDGVYKIYSVSLVDGAGA